MCSSDLYNGSSAVIDAMVNTINNAVRAAKNAAQIASPSKRFDREVGAQIPAGVGQGVKKNADIASDAVSDMIDQSASARSGLIGGLINGFVRNRSRIQDALQTVVGNMSILASASVVSPGTAYTATGGSTDNSRNINQDVKINNSFYGDRAIQQNAASAMNDAAEDVTSTLAKGLAYAR